ncbi:MAG: MFS transporter [Nitrospirales bacterium]|nr:MFS transporter [Nitrospirales bacterium]
MIRTSLQAIRAGHWPSLMSAWLHFEVSFIVWLLIGALGVAIAEEFNLSSTQKGFLVAVPLLGGACLRIVVGPLADWFGVKPIGLAVLGAEILALFLAWHFGTTYLQMLGIGLLIGVAGASFAIALPLASQAYPPAHQGLAMGVAAIGNSGVLLATFFAPRIANEVGWHQTFGLMIVPVVFTALVFWWVVPWAYPQTPSIQKRAEASSIPIKRQQPFLIWLCGLYGVTFGGFVGFTSFFPIFFHDQYQLDMVAAGTMTALCGLAGSLARPIGGHLADKFGGIGLLQMALGIIAVLSLALSGLFPAYLTFPLAIGMLLLLGFGNGMVFQVVSLRFQGAMGTASGFIGAAGGLGGFFLPSSFGILKDVTGTYGGGFLMFAFCAGIAAVSVLKVGRAFKLSLPDSRVESHV